MIDPQTVEYYQRNAVEYAAATASRGMPMAIQRLSDGLPPGSAVIDIGCGGGRDLLEFRRRRFNAVGLDVSSHLAAIAAKFSGCPVVAADMTEMPFVAGSFDAAWASASLLHFSIDEVPRALTEIRRVLRPGSRFFSSVKQGEGVGRDSTGRQFTYFGPDQWVSLVGDAGFEPAEIFREQDSEEDRGKWIRVLARCG